MPRRSRSSKSESNAYRSFGHPVHLAACLSTLTAAGFTMGTLLSVLMPDYANAEQVSFNDPDIMAEYATFPSPERHQEGRGYLVTPASLSGKAPVVLVIHENRGLNPYVKDVARRVAKAGFIGFAPDALHSLGGYPGNDDEGRKMQGSMDRSKIEQDFIAAARFLKAHEVPYTLHLYPEANHGFHNDSTGRYDEKSAELAWERTLAFFTEQLG